MVFILVLTVDMLMYDGIETDANVHDTDCTTLQMHRGLFHKAISDQ